MAQQQLAVAITFPCCVASRKARREGPANMQIQSDRAFSFFEGRLASAAQNASIKQAIVPCIMLPKAHNFGWATLGMDRLLGSSSQRGSLH
jgi:hypothetical protein